MKTIITEEMGLREKVCKYAEKHGVTKAARKYHTNRQFVYRQMEKYNGDVRSLGLKSRKAKSYGNQHTDEEIELIIKVYKRYGRDGLAEVYVQLKKREYKRSYFSTLFGLDKLLYT